MLGVQKDPYSQSLVKGGGVKENENERLIKLDRKESNSPIAHAFMQ